MSHLDKVSAAEFKEIVREMKPIIGCFGGRYFKAKKRSYTMNQITETYIRLHDSREMSLYGQEGVELSTLILEKDKKATALLGKASCFQKKMTRIKQKWGNKIFKNQHSKFIGKKDAFDMMSAALRLINEASPVKPAKPSQKTLKALNVVDSTKLVFLGNIRSRSDFMSANWEVPPAIWTYSKDLVPEDIVRRLIKLKKNQAAGVKYEVGDTLKNMEGALHTFLTPISRVHLLCKENQARQVVFSGIVQPDFEYDTVFLEVAAIQNEAIVGKELSVERTEEALRRHMIYHLTSGNRLPGKSEVQVLSSQEADALFTELLEKRDLTEEDLQKMLNNKAVLFKNKVISLEVMFRTYLHQVRNEMRLLEEALPQGYVYTLPPPSNFLQALGGDARLTFNRLHALALKWVHRQTPLHNMRLLVFDNSADPLAIGALKNALIDKPSISSRLLYQGEEKDNAYLENALLPEDLRNHCQGAALVIHNHFNGFGQNIEFDDSDVIGAYSDAYATLARHRTDFFITSVRGEYKALD